MQLKKLERKNSLLFVKKTVFPILLVLLFLLVYHTWIFNPAILTSTDWWFYNNETMTSVLIHIFSVWFVDFTAGRVLLELGQAPIYIWYGILPTYFHFNYALVERIVHIWPIIIFTPLTSYLFLKSIFKNNVASFVGVLVYSFNTYFIILQTAQVTLMAADAFIPLGFLLYKITLEKLKVYLAFLTGLVFFICSSYEPRVFYLVVWLLVFYTFFQIFSQKRQKKQIIKLIFIAFIPIITVLLLSSFWILALSQTGSLRTNELFSRNLFGSEFYNILNAITLFHPFWTGTKPAVFVLQTIPFYFWIIPLFAFFGLLLNKNNKTVIFFGFISLLGILLSKQVGPPFTSIYYFLYDHIPGFNAFREASKFYTYIAFGYSVLIASLIEWLWTNFRRVKWQSILTYSLTILIICIFLLNTKPIITGEIGNLFMPKKIPNDYFKVNKFLLQQNSYSRILWVPESSRWSVYTNEHPQLNSVDLITTDWNKFIKDKQKNLNNTEADLMIDSLKIKYANNLIDRSSIKYVIVPLKDTSNDDNFFQLFAKERGFYIKGLNKIKYLKRINIGTKEIVIYSNEYYRPHIYITNQEEALSQNIPFQNVNFRFLKPSEYKVTINHISTPMYLTFTDTFHPDWKLRVGNFHWYSIFFNKNYFNDDKYHIQNDTSSNTFYINPKDLCREYSCNKNNDGSYKMELTLYFKPQSYLYMGGIMSITTFLIIGCFFIYLLIKNKLWK